MSQLLSTGDGKRKGGKSRDIIASDHDDLRHVKPEEAALMLGWSLRTLERRSDDGTGPKITRTGPRSRSVRVDRIRKFLAACDEADTAG